MQEVVLNDARRGEVEETAGDVTSSEMRVAIEQLFPSIPVTQKLRQAEQQHQALCRCCLGLHYPDVAARRPSLLLEYAFHTSGVGRLAWQGGTEIAGEEGEERNAGYLTPSILLCTVHH
jgi:hypothetical protein